MAEKRKLAAILAADVVGFSRLTGSDEDRTLARLRALRSDLIDPTIAVHNGRVFKRTGDGALVEFRSVVDAVRCAIEVQNAMVERNAGVAHDRRIEFRIGIHVGEVVEESDGDMMGDSRPEEAKRTAARLMAARPQFTIAGWRKTQFIRRDAARVETDAGSPPRRRTSPRDEDSPARVSRSHVRVAKRASPRKNSTILCDNPKGSLCCGGVGPGLEAGPTGTSTEEHRFLNSWLKRLKSLDSRKEKIWISLPFPWNFLPCDLEISSFGLENASAAPRAENAVL